MPRPRPSQLGSSSNNSSSALPAASPNCPVAGPALRLIPATPVDPSMNTNIMNRLDSLEKPSTNSVSSTVHSDLTVEIEVSSSSKTTPNLSRNTSIHDKNIDTTISRSSSVKSRSRASSFSVKAASDLLKSGKASETKLSKKSSLKSSPIQSFKKQQAKNSKRSEEKPSPTPSLVRSNTTEKQFSKKSSTLQKSIRLVKKKSMRKGESVDDSCSVASPGKVQKKNSFYKVMDKLRGMSSRRSSMVSGESGGQIEFLDSISRMSDSRIVENWLLSLDDDQQNPEPVDGPSSIDLSTSENFDKSLNPPKSRTEDMVTPTNEHFELDTKAGASEKNKIIFDLNFDDDMSNLDEEKLTRRNSKVNGRNFGRQISESSEYTTDTHDTGETAHVTALNTLRNTSSIFTSEGDEMRKINLSPPSTASTIFKPILPPETEDLEVEAINSDRTDSHQTSKSNETVKTLSSTAQVPCYRVPSEPEGSDAQGRERPGVLRHQETVREPPNYCGHPILLITN